ncbi:cupin domain-containing protein [Kineosporia babensis]|uniref:Zinc-finger domain-containing protein n=1 Tax=Kineosporia babensis TaxID=499548 RepID=A0A9X1N9U4_9ACTN|nr:hypothetical protein [Kineosporia babensis]MCD5309944.1 hypothetical protein [Kineosporia babensis]
MPAHPEDELLADLAADVLPIDVARQVETHVMGCARCSQVLADAESVRAMLRQAPPEAMPREVLGRLEQAFTAVRQGQEPQPMPRRAQAGPMRRDSRAASGAHTGPQTQRPRSKPGPEQTQRPRQSTGQNAGPEQTSWPRPNQQSSRPEQETTQWPRPGQEQDPDQTQRPQQPVHSNPQRPAELDRSSQNSSSYRVRSFKRQEAEDAYPVDGPTALHPAVRDDNHDPELTQPVRKRRRVAPASEQQSALSQMTQQIRPVRDKGPAKLTRMDSTQTIRVRRQAMEEQKADVPSRWPKISPGIAAAALLVMALVGGVGAWQVLGGGAGGDSGEGASTAAGSADAAPMITSVQETGTKYQEDDLPAQIGQLVKQRNATLSTESGDASSSSSEGTLKAQEKDEAAAEGGAVADNQLLKDPEALQACLKAIDREGTQPVAVDLATYDNREAALIVLPGTSGGYDVWIVARTCQPGDDGTIDVVEVNS